MLIIAIAVFALTSAGGFGLYTYDSLKESTARDTGHLTLTTPGYFAKEEEMPLSNGLTHADDITKQLIGLNEVRGVQPRVEFSGLISNGNKSSIFIGIGVNEREFDMKGPFLDVREGQTLSNIHASRYDPAEPEVMLGVDLANNLSVHVGDWITLLAATTTDGALNAYDFKVRGIYSTGVPELDKRQLYVHINSAQSLLGSDKVSALSVFLFDTSLTSQVEQQVASVLSKQKQNFGDQDIEITPWQERAFFYLKVKDLYDRIFGIMGAVMALVVFVALFNTMTMSVTERTREIGTLSALGSYPREIIAGFLREAGLLAVIGSLNRRFVYGTSHHFTDGRGCANAATARTHRRLPIDDLLLLGAGSCRRIRSIDDLFGCGVFLGAQRGEQANYGGTDLCLISNHYYQLHC